MVLEPFALEKLFLTVSTAAVAAIAVRILSYPDVPSRGRWVSKEDVDAMRLKVPMPGLGKEHVKVWADQDGLMIEGEGDKNTEYYDDDDKALPPRSYSHRIELPADAFKMDQINQGGDEGWGAQGHRAQEQGREAQGRVPGQGRVGSDGISQSIRVS